jgi:hypothetical protein
LAKILQYYQGYKIFTDAFLKIGRSGNSETLDRNKHLGDPPLNYKQLLSAFACAHFLFPSLSFGHSRLSVTTANGAIPRLIPRNSSETITVEFEETIGHAGTFQLNFSQAGLVNFTTLAPAQTDDNTPVGAVPNKGQFQFTVPNTPCTDCTIQFTQDMSGTLHYKSCVDVIITPANTPPPAQPAGFAVTK